MAKHKILFLAANPQGTSKLDLDEEIREIDAKIQGSHFRDYVEMVSHWAVRADELQGFLMRHKPHVVHFSGHGSEANEIILVSEDGSPKPVSSAALRALFGTLKDNLRLVVLNACFSRGQSEAIVENIDCAVGMKKAVGDQAAITFAAAFYQALGFGRSVQEAFELGKTALMLEGIPEHDTPELIVKRGASANSVRLVQPESTSQASARSSGAVQLWREKLSMLLEAEAIETDAARKFQLTKQIEEAQRRIKDLGENT